MASKNTVTLTFAGDAKGLEQSFDRVGSGAKNMGAKVDEASDRLDRVGEAADTADTRAMGFRDTMTGVEDTTKGVGEIMKGNVFDGVLLLGMGFGDLASGVANFGVQFAKQAGQFIANTGRMVATQATAVATTIAGWVAQGAAALVAGAQMALAWLIGLGPIALVIVAIAAIIGILAFLGVGFDDVAKVAGIALDFVVGAALGVFHWVQTNWPLLLAILTGPFGLAVLAIVKNWDSIKGGATAVKDWIVARLTDMLSFITGLPGRVTEKTKNLFEGFKGGFRSAMNWVIGKWNSLSFTLPSFSAFGKTIGGNTISVPRLPTFHAGGTFRAPAGQQEGFARLVDGEEVNRPGQGGTGGVTWTGDVIVHGSVRSDRDLVRVIRDELGRGGFGGGAAA
jgi:hypothetical protein